MHCIANIYTPHYAIHIHYTYTLYIHQYKQKLYTHIMYIYYVKTIDMQYLRIHTTLYIHTHYTHIL